VAVCRGLLVILLGAAATVVIIAGIQATAWLIGPAFLALIVVIAAAPVQGWLRRHSWPGWATGLVVLILVYGSLPKLTDLADLLALCRAMGLEVVSVRRLPNEAVAAASASPE
jgi:hypothetical protein